MLGVNILYSLDGIPEIVGIGKKKRFFSSGKAHQLIDVKKPKCFVDPPQLQAQATLRNSPTSFPSDQRSVSFPRFKKVEFFTHLKV